MWKLKGLITLFCLILLSSCGSDLSYEEKINNYNNLVEKANSQIENRNYSGALSYAKSAIKITDTLPGAFVSKGTALYRLGELKKARKSFDKVIKIEGDESRAYKLRALVYLKMDNSKFVDDIDEYLKHYDDEEAHEIRREYFVSKNNFKEAISGYNLAIKKYKDSVELYVKRSELYLQNGDYKEALNDYDKILTLDPNSSSTKSKKISLINKIHLTKNRNLLIIILIGIFVAYVLVSFFILKPMVLKKAKNQIGGVYTVGMDRMIWILPIVLLITFLGLSYFDLIPNLLNQ